MSAVFSGACDFIAGAALPEQVPPVTLPEIAFAGRSNVGKSSLINALTGRKKLARTSRTPGRTQQLNFFSIGGTFVLVDMPGYGYAQVSKGQKEAWENLIHDYLRRRETLRCVFVLVDARHGLKDSDRDFMTLLYESAMPYRLALTKADKAEVDRHVLGEIKAALKQHTAAYPEPLVTSAHDGAGIEELREIVLTAVR